MHIFNPNGSRFIVALLLAFLTGLTTAQAETIKIGGTGNALGTMKLLAKAYSQSNPSIEVIVLPSIGSSGGIKAVEPGAIDIGLSSRPLKQAEQETAIRSVEYARSPTVIAVSNSSSVNAISIAELTKIYAGELLNWPDGTLIRPILRQPGDDNTVQLKSLSPLLEQAIESADNRTGSLFASTDQEAVDKISRTPGSFGVTSLALIISENRALRALALDGIEPTPTNSASGQYPLVKHFYLILPKQIPTHVEDFVMFIKSSEGAAILVNNGHSVVP